MTVQQFIRQLRQLVLEHPHAASVPIVMAQHGKGHHPRGIGRLHLNEHGTAIVIEAEYVEKS